MFLCIPWVELKIWLIQRVLEYTSLCTHFCLFLTLSFSVSPLCELCICEMNRLWRHKMATSIIWQNEVVICHRRTHVEAHVKFSSRLCCFLRRQCGHRCMCVCCLYFLLCWCCFCSLTSCVRVFPWRREQTTLLWLSVLSFNKLAPWSLTSFAVVCLTFTVVVREVFSFPVISSRADFLHFALDCCECHRFTFLKCWSVSYNNTLIGDRTSCCLSCSSFVFPAWDLSSLSAAALFQKQPHLSYVDALIYPRFVLWLKEVSIYGAWSLGTQYLKC